MVQVWNLRVCGQHHTLLHLRKRLEEMGLNPFITVICDCHGQEWVLPEEAIYPVGSEEDCKEVDEIED